MATIAALKHYARQDIDRSAGVARLRYITDVPGQQGVYLVKLEQAQAFVAAYAASTSATAPPYIAAETAATGSTPIAAANNIVSIAAQWSNVIGPSIEQQRIAGKLAVTAAADEASIESARVAAINALDAI